MKKRNIFVFVCFGLVSLIILTTSQPAFADSASITRVSISSNGIEADGVSYVPSVSADGRYIAFQSDATNLVTGDTNDVADIFVRDCQTNLTTRVSVASSGEESNGDSYRPSISGDGRYVTFESNASNLVAGDYNGKTDIFLHDRNTEITTMISVSSDEILADDNSGNSDISSDGNFVVFDSEATNLVPGDTNNAQDVFIRDLVNGTAERISVSSSGGEGYGSSVNGSVSADGTFVVFSSNASNLIAGDTNDRQDVFVRDLAAGTTTRVSISSFGEEGNSDSENKCGSSISNDGRYVTFTSSASDLAYDDTNGIIEDVFIHDLLTSTTTLVSVSSSGMNGDNNSRLSSISSDGRYVVFESSSTNLVPTDHNGSSDIFIHDMVDNTTNRVSENSGLGGGNADSGYPHISANGMAIVFHSFASDLVDDDTNGFSDVFIVAQASPEIEILTYFPLIVKNSN
jgi:Tol biopolymer transport system component